MGLESLPENEIVHAELIVQNLDDLGRYVGSFSDALSLHRFCQSQGKEVRGWQRVAGRDATLTIFHFASTMRGIRAAFKECPEFRKLVDHTKLREAEKAFKASFPDYELLRHAVAHAGELYATVEKREANMARSVDDHGIKVDESSRIAIGDAFSGDNFLQNIDGQMVALELSEASLEALTDCAAIFASGFPGPAADMQFILFKSRF